MKGPAPSIPLQYSPNLRDLVASLLSKNPTLRPEARTILTRPFICDRISNFLSDQQIQTEFSHTILHGFQAISVSDVVRPEPDPRIMAPNIKPAYRNQSPPQFQHRPKALIPRPQVIPVKEKRARRPLHEPKHVVGFPKVVGRAIGQQAAKPAVPPPLRSPKLLAAKPEEGHKDPVDDIAKPPDRNGVDSNGVTVRMIDRNAVEKDMPKPQASPSEEKVNPEIAPSIAGKRKENTPSPHKTGFKWEGGGSGNDAILKIQAQMLQLQDNLQKMGRNPSRSPKGAKAIQIPAPSEQKPKVEDTSVDDSSDSGAESGINLPHGSITMSQEPNEPLAQIIKVLPDAPTYKAADQEQRKREFIRFREESRRLLKGEGKLFVELHVAEPEILAKAAGSAEDSSPVEDSIIKSPDSGANVDLDLEKTLVTLRNARVSRVERGGCNLTPSPVKDDMPDSARGRRLSREKQREEMRQKIAQDKGKKKSPDHWLNNVEIMVGKLPSPPIYCRPFELCNSKVMHEDSASMDLADMPCDYHFAPISQEDFKYPDNGDMSAVSGPEESDPASAKDEVRHEAGVIFPDHMEDVKVEPSSAIDKIDSDDQWNSDLPFRGPAQLEDEFKLVAGYFSDAENQCSDFLVPNQDYSDSSSGEKGREMSAIFEEAFGIRVDGSDEEDDAYGACNDKFTFSDAPLDPEAEPLVYVGRGVVVGGSHASTRSSSHRGAEEEYATMLEQMKEVLKMAADESNIDEEDEYEGPDLASECRAWERSDSNDSSLLDVDEALLSVPPVGTLGGHFPDELEERENQDSGEDYKGVEGNEQNAIGRDKSSLHFSRFIDESDRNDEDGLNLEESSEKKEETVDPTEVVPSTTELSLLTAYTLSILGKGSETDAGSREPKASGSCPALDVDVLLRAGMFEELGISESTSTASKIEAIRFYLEGKLGLEPFLNSYRYMRSVHCQGRGGLSEGQLSEVIRTIIYEDPSCVVSLIWKLLELETELYSF